MNPDSKKRVSYDSIKIEPMREEYVQPSIELWTTQFKNVKNMVQDISGKWVTDSMAIRVFIEEHAEKGRGVVAKTDGNIIGYMVYDSLPFHGADTAYCPIMGHASIESMTTRPFSSFILLWVAEDLMTLYLAPCFLASSSYNTEPVVQQRAPATIKAPQLNFDFKFIWENK